MRTRFAAEEADFWRVAGEALLPHTLCQFNKYMLLPSNLYCQQCSTAVICSNSVTLQRAMQLHHITALHYQASRRVNANRCSSFIRYIKAGFWGQHRLTLLHYYLHFQVHHDNSGTVPP